MILISVYLFLGIFCIRIIHNLLYELISNQTANLPNSIDLEDIYPDKYKRLDFWDNSDYDMDF